MAQSAVLTRYDLHKCCLKNLNDNERVVFKNAYMAIRAYLKQPVTCNTARTLAGRLQKCYPSAWKTAKPEKQGGQWTFPQEQAVELFQTFDAPIRKAIGLGLPKAEIKRPNKRVSSDVTTSESEVGGSTADADHSADEMSPELLSTGSDVRDKGKQVIRDPPAAMDVDTAAPDISAEAGEGSSSHPLVASDAVPHALQKAEMRRALQCPEGHTVTTVAASPSVDQVLQDPQLLHFDVYVRARLSGSQYQYYQMMALARIRCGNDKFPVKFDPLWQALEYSRRDNAKRILTSKNKENNDPNFIEGVDFIRMLHSVVEHPYIEEARQGSSAEDIRLTLDAAKRFAMLCQTPKGSEIRDMFIKLTDIYEERDQIGHVTAVNPSRSVLTEQQAANVTQEQDFVQKWEKATAPHRLMLEGVELVYVPHVIADLFFNGDTTLASTAIRDWHFTDPTKSGMRESLMPKKDEKGSFHKVSNPRNPNTKVFACKPLDLIDFLLQSPAAKRFGLTRLSTNNLVRKLGGDPSLHDEIDTNALASAGTSIHRLARTEEVGSSSTSALVLAPPAPPPRKPRQPRHRLGFYLYAGKNGAYIKIGYTSNLIDRTSAYDGDILVAFEDYSPEGEAMFKAWETRLLRLIPAKYRVPGKDEHFYLEGLCEFFGITVSDPEVFFKVAFACIAPFGDSCESYVLRVLNEEAGMFDRLDTDETISAFALRMGRAAPLSRKRKRDDTDIEIQLRTLTLREESKRHKVEQEQETDRLKHQQEQETKRGLINAVVQSGNSEMLRILLEKIHL